MSRQEKDFFINGKPKKLPGDTGFKFMKLGALKRYGNKAIKFSKGVDYLRLKLPGPIEFFHECIKKLDTDNSNSMHTVIAGYELSLVKTSLKHGYGIIAELQYRGVPTPIFIYEEYREDVKRKWKAWGKIDFYGKFFRLIELEYMNIDFIDHIFPDLELYSITRLDYRMDFYFDQPIGVLPRHRLVNARSNSKVRSYGTGKSLETWYYGKAKDVSRCMIRMYDKKRDTEVKDNFWLWEDIHKYEDVIRLEYQLGRKFTKGYRLVELDKLIEKVERAINLKFNKPIYKPRKENPNLTSMTYKQYIGRGYTIYKAGENPFTVQFEGLLQKTMPNEDGEIELHKKEIHNTVLDFVEYYYKTPEIRDYLQKTYDKRRLLLKKSENEEMSDIGSSS